MILRTVFLIFMLGLVPACTFTSESVREYRLGREAEKIENNQKAIDHYEKALLLDSKNIIFMERIAVFYASLELRKDYIRLMLKSFELRVKKHEKTKAFAKIMEITKEAHERYDFETVTPLYEKIIALSLEAFPAKDSAILAKAHHDYADILIHKQENEKALPLLKVAIEAISRVSPPEPDNKSLYLNDLAAVHYDMDNFALAEPLYLEAATLSESTTPNRDTPALAIRYSNLGRLYYATDKHEKAYDYFKKAVIVGEKAWPNHDEQKLADYYFDLAEQLETYHTPKDAKETGETAEKYYRNAVDVALKAWPQPTHEKSKHLRQLARYYVNNNRRDAAEQLFLDAIANDEKIIPRDSIALEENYHNLGQFYERQEKYDEAILYYKKSIALCEELWPQKQMPFVGLRYTNLADTYYIRNNLIDAEIMYKNAIAVGEVLSPNNLELAHFYGNYALFLHQKKKDLKQAESFYAQSLQIFEAHNEPDADGFEQMVENYEKFLIESKQTAKAKALRKKHPF